MGDMTFGVKSANEALHLTDSLEWTAEARERLRRAAKQFGKQKDLAAAAGIPVPTLQNILSDQGGDPGISKVARLAAALGLSIDFVLSGNSSGAIETVRLPMIGVTASAGPGSIDVDDGVQAEWTFPRSWLRQSFGREDKLELLRVVGDSQEPLLKENDWVMVDVSHIGEVRDGLYAVVLDEVVMVKRLQWEGRGRVRLLSENPRYQPIEVDLSQDIHFDVLGRVVWNSRLNPD
jgi:phage repressor protein C with HTH and peptisase S24 domain